MDATPRDPAALSRVKALLGEAGLAQTFAPIEVPSGLPNAAYCAPEWLALEQERILRRSWIFAGAEAELAEPGAARPLDIAGAPILLVRGEDGALRAFHNHCPHRGTQLLTEPCVGRTLTCPYHAWVFRLDGRLRSRAHFQGAGALEKFEDGGGPALDLKSVRCETWQGCIFVNLSGDAPPLLDWLAPMFARTRAYDLSQLRWIGKSSYTIQSNWKLVLENYMESYHVYAAHPRLIAHAPMQVRWSGEWTDHVFYNDYLAPKLTEGRGEGLPHYPDLTDEDRRRGLWLVCLPNFAVEVFVDQFVVLATYPLAPGVTYEELHFFVVGGEAATDPRHAAGRAELMQMWHELNLEDVDILERLQQGRRSAGFHGSMMSPAWEPPAHQLAAKVVEEILRP